MNDPPSGSGIQTGTDVVPESELRLIRPNGSVRDAWIAGWREHINLPGLKVRGLVAKLDTGARTSALHARVLNRSADRRGRIWLSFELLAPEEDAGADPPEPARKPPAADAAAGQRPAGVTSTSVPLVVPEGPARALWVGDRVIRSSNGAEELRPVIRTKIELGGHRWRAEVTLAERGTMGYPLLLGRTALRQRFLVHPGRSFLADAPSVVADT
ncbi:ATP-dependent zinc protease [Candidatus Microthrix parvicella]|uniref:ATP-dependent zinc protease family protein n=1 Tax=Candidatus Neomicrothrix parvicella TaxID=41950 RepID=UPI00036CBAA1|nr:RimK/LysX family protein [Candidatus Microthrix parvicella]